MRGKKVAKASEPSEPKVTLKKGTSAPSPGDGDWVPAFLAHLSKSANVRASCAAAGVSRKTAYARRRSNSEFASEWNDALEDALDILESIAFKRAAEKSDLLVIFLLKAHRRELYGDRLPEKSSGLPNGGLSLDHLTLEQLKSLERLLTPPGSGTGTGQANPAV